MKSFKWLGKELETDGILFYVEILFEGELAGAEIKNSTFFESFSRTGKFNQYPV